MRYNGDGVSRKVLIYNKKTFILKKKIGYDLRSFKKIKIEFTRNLHN